MATAKVTVFFILSVGLVSACFGPVEVGKPCENNGNGTERGIHYFFDDLRNRIYPFFYEGCGGESHNRFKTEQKARMCLAMDMQTCGGFAPSTGSCSNHPRPPAGITPFPALREEKCPEGSECKLLWNGGGGFCCDKAIADRYNINRMAVCKQGTKAATSEDGEILFGRKCEHKFCPANYDCVQGEFEAYCCPA